MRRHRAERVALGEVIVTEEQRVRGRERASAWAREHPMQVRARNARRRALKQAAFVENVDPGVVLARDDGICGLCGDPVDPENFHVDHVRPLVLGGLHSYDNVQVAHPDCNISKGARYIG